MSINIEMRPEIHPGTPKGVTISGDIGYILHDKQGLSLEEIKDSLLKTQWKTRVDITPEVLQDYVNGELVLRDDETGKYSMTSLGHLCFMSGQW